MTAPAQRRAVIVAGARTPFVRAFGDFTRIDTIALADEAVRGLLDNTKISSNEIEAIVWGGVILPAGAPNIAREIALDLKLGHGVEGHTVTRACASGLQAIIAGAACGGGRKEMLVGLLFAGGVAVPLLADRPQQISAWLPSVGAFAALCGLNCRLIDRWEHSPASPLTLDVGIAAFASVSLALVGPSSVALCVTVSVLFLLALHRYRKRLGVRAVRVLADVALLTPLLGAVA